MHTTLIEAELLHEHLNHPLWRVIDCRAQLGNPDYGPNAFLHSHIPGAVHAHLEQDLSGPIVPGKTGRHPLPNADVFAQRLSQWRISNVSQVVVYDDAGGAYASRLWWMLRWMGHEQVAVLNGGWQRWQACHFATEHGEAVIKNQDPVVFVGQRMNAMLIDAATLQQSVNAHTLIDARGNARYQGENETIDPVAGHIPGALSFPFTENLAEDGKFLALDALKKRFARFEDQEVISYCGSGVTACHNILAMVHAGFHPPKLYPGSWSEWITNPERPIAKGPNP